MPKKSRYEVAGDTFTDFKEAAARAVDLSVQTAEPATIVERGWAGTFYITVSATAEEVT